MFKRVNILPEESYGPGVIPIASKDKLCSDCDCNWEKPEVQSVALPAGSSRTRRDKWGGAAMVEEYRWEKRGDDGGG